jgi:hypothetical protein
MRNSMQASTIDAALAKVSKQKKLTLQLLTENRNTEKRDSSLTQLYNREEMNYASPLHGGGSPLSPSQYRRQGPRE